MADPIYEIQDNPTYETQIRALQDSDPARATTIFNPLMETLINNTHAVKLAGDVTTERVEEVAQDAGDPSTIILDSGKTVEEAITELETKKAALVSPALTGTPTAPTAPAATNSTQIATTAFVKAQAYAPLASPTLAGTPAAPTPAAGTNTTQLATTAFVTTAVATRIATTEKGAASGVATLGTDSVIPLAQIPVLPKLGIGYGTSTTAAATAAKVATLANFTLVTGAIIGISFTNANTSAAATLNVNSTGAKAIYFKGAAITNTMITAGMLALFQYNGTQWVLLNPAGGALSDLTALHVLQITFDSSFAGLSFTVNGDTAARTGTVPATAPYVVNVGVSKPNTTYNIVVSSYSNTVTTGAFFGIYPVTVEPISTTLANNTWAQIATIAQAGTAANYWSVGDTKDIVVAGETLTLQIFGFNHDDLAAGGKAGITFGLKNLMAATRAMNATNVNTGGFTGSAMYTWLTGTLLPSLPSDLQALIKNVNKKTSAGAQSTTINTNSMKVFLFSEIECFGVITYSVAGEGAQYPVFTNATSRIKYLSNGGGSANYWWERSPGASNSTYFCIVSSSGSANANGASYTLGVCFGFCI